MADAVDDLFAVFGGEDASASSSSSSSLSRSGPKSSVESENVKVGEQDDSLSASPAVQKAGASLQVERKRQRLSVEASNGKETESSRGESPNEVASPDGDASALPGRKRRRREADAHEEPAENEESESREEDQKTRLVVKLLASDKNCTHEVIRPADCETAFHYYPFETTLPEYRTQAEPAEKKKAANEASETEADNVSPTEKSDEQAAATQANEGENGVKRTPARQYKFRLDAFQQRSVLCLEAGESVLVAAHTSAGKTVVAEYAIAMSIRDKQRVVYTSPIKALSNQKYRDLSESFGAENVGLMTGDVTLHPNASIMVMTTEILRSMLYRGSHLVNELKWLIFDEIHYMRDRERGVVWEESIVLVPATMRFVFLSATIPNAREFAEWVAAIKHQPCHVLYTDYRPTPLQHYMFPAGGEGVYLVMDEKKVFREENFHKAVATLHKTVEEQAMETKQMQRRGRARNRSSIEKLVLMCHARQYTPVIIFCFSKRECEANATALLGGNSAGRGSGNVDLTTDEEKQLIEEIFNNALETLEEEDRNLPQVKSILPLLKRGIGIHHGGLLPFVKEMIEILFQESLLRVLFSTETFSMGVNMPAKTVIFTAIRKFDGQEYRIVNSGEYIQMAGRAGRRGLDDRGIVIIMFDEQVDPEEAKQLFMGQGAPLISTFHLGFNMLLNLFRIEDANPTFMITRSFAHFQRNRKALHLEKEKEELEEEVKKVREIHALADVDEKDRPSFDVEAAVCEYYELKHDLAGLGKELRNLAMQERYILRYLQAGRIVRLVEENGTDWGWATCLSKISNRCVPSTNAVMEGPAEQLVVDCLVACAPESIRDEDGKGVTGAVASSEKPRPAKNVDGVEKKDYVLAVVPFTISSIRSISKCRMTLPVGVDVRSGDARRSLHFQLKKVEKRFEPEGGIPLLDPLEDMKIPEPRLPELVAAIAEKERQLTQNPLYEHPLCGTYYDAHHRRVQLQTKLRTIRESLDNQKQLVMKDTLRAMRRVLRQLDFLDANDVVTVKGRVACEITTADELVAAELLFQNVFETMEVEAVCALLSCLVFQEKHDEPEPKEEVLLSCLEKVKEVAKHIAGVCVESRYIDPLGASKAAEGSGSACTQTVDDYVNKFQHAIMSLTYRWAKGEKFADVVSGTSIYEGTVIRCLRRLEELMRQMACASKSIGNPDLEKKFLEGIKKIRRGIVFSSSLYL
ncbi:DEAD/DEAH box helicase family protein, related [Neospora caninum Liverpool]|uniref:DEAD/DEAH box helicase family protein, related n=1 Tax=Neospora caninum (strain Liverpool) TaxID=572307 RepID=F0VD43_NEOCL|nr:DEAD/DEAH box helicase family protein, related [Neospora caninum Liverpool]CBZ51558.1 DEAD/DEAH box helicase family protein, related [Neospora caninum Liverpool]CEL65509.1 TPA: DEAD/DEAH box helicase family protein, related [Neospora caninum Liverpool]|eukprot:XP_003881591.1 DEAD/DEAH box helicase family protein, related [Neospora caninum Liverpool]